MAFMAYIWNLIVTWVKSKGGFAHVVAGVFAGAVLAYGAVPAFATFVNNVYNTMPSWLHQLILVSAALYAWYKRTSSAAGAMQHVKEDQAAEAAQ